MTALRIQQELLHGAYSAGRNPVAFIDESYLAPGAVPHSQAAPFYLMAAYVLPRAELNEVRHELRRIAGAEYWHSTQAHQSENGRRRIHDFARYIATGADELMISVRTPVEHSDSGGERARVRCFGLLLGALERGEAGDGIGLAVFEERKFMTQRNADARIIARARTSAIISRQLRVIPASPSHEKLLWLPDLLAFAMYQQRVGGSQNYSHTFRERVIEVRV
ncbi:hypothetical protein M2390_002567 [Mycetocola sp. BIGb0189]|uniref:hypothetical protein n=1 Tax=Mycetocola sp. BIGb0189 TaxID=2940604 RepID=UPI00216752AD|nr:hypothetical protein [Mycetocola sp. BIGb0189]MCS4277363.1 hypothetical protein [Mycetocola sp. BIGb0189]